MNKQAFVYSVNIHNGERTYLKDEYSFSPDYSVDEAIEQVRLLNAQGTLHKTVWSFEVEVMPTLEHFANSFEEKTRDSGDRYIICTEDMYQDLIRELHQGRFSNDQDYRDILDIAQALEHLTIDEEDNSVCSEELMEAIDSQVETRYSILMEMLVCPDFREIANRMVRGYCGDISIEDACQRAHYEKLSNMAYTILNHFNIEVM